MREEKVNVNESTPASVVGKPTDTLSINRAEYEFLLRDEAQLDIILQSALHMASYELKEVVDLILKMRGMKA